MKNQNTKNNEGITLIALIITIIILLILAMVSIRLVINGGIITRAENATNKYQTEQEMEQIALAYTNYQMSKYMGDITDPTVNGATTSGNSTDGWVIEFEKGNAYKLYPDGTIEPLDGGNTIIAWDGTTKTEVEEENNVYLISNAAELAWFADQVNSGNLFEGKTVKLTRDIDLGNKEWTPIGTITPEGAYNLFGGTTGATFDGNGYSIKNIKVSSCSLPAVGLFIAMQNGTIQNLGIESGIIEGVGADSVDQAATKCSVLGGILGIAMGNVTISECYNNGVNLKYVTRQSYTSAGIVAGNMGNLTITNCYNTATNLEDSLNEGMIGFAGIFGSNASGTASTTITNCYNIGNVTGDNSTCTGIYNQNDGNLQVSNCYTVASYDAHALKTSTGITITGRESIQTMIDNAFNQ